MIAAVLGAGAWGTALARLIAARGVAVRLWVRRGDLAADLRERRENAIYLPGFPIPGAVEICDHLKDALAGAELVVIAIPVQHIRELLAPAAEWVSPSSLRLGASKGIERLTDLRVSQVLTEVWGGGQYAVLSGPSFAVEVAEGQPTAVTVASEAASSAAAVQQLIASDSFRVYTSKDVVGVELGGALKNVIAIAAGIVRGLGFGSNTLAALLTRGLAEVTRLGVILGGRHETFLGLAGMGDLVLTCTGRLSRNVRLGELLAGGGRLDELVAGSRTVAEGVETARSGEALALKHGVEMPITREVVNILFRGRPPRAAVKDLMGRDLKAE